MALKILRRRGGYHSSSDSSLSSPELEEKGQKFSLFRPPVTFHQKTSTVAPSGTFPPCSTPCSNAPPFQLSQTLLSPVSKESTDSSFKKPKPPNATNAREKTFDNLFRSEFPADTSSDLLVCRREKPLSRRNNEHDVERTRQYGGKPCSNKIFVEDCEGSELIIPLSPKNHQERVRPRTDREVSVRETATKTTNNLNVESVKRKVLLEPRQPKDLEGMKKSPAKASQKKKSEPEVQNTVAIQTTRETCENKIVQQSSILNKSGRKTRSSLSQVEKENPGQEIEQKLNERKNRAEDTSTGENIRNDGLVGKTSATEVRDDRATLKSAEKSNENNKSLRINLTQIKSPNFGFQQIQPNCFRRESSRLEKSRRSQGKENSAAGDIPKVYTSVGEAVKVGSTERDAATESKRRSVRRKDESLPLEKNKSLEPKIGEEILSPVLLNTSKAAKKKEQAFVVGEGNYVPTKRTKRKTIGEDRSEENDVSVTQTRRSVGSLKNTALDNIDDASRQQKSVVENPPSLKLDYLRQVGLSSKKQFVEKGLHSGEKQDDLSRNNGAMKNSEDCETMAGQNCTSKSADTSKQKKSNRSTSSSRSTERRKGQDYSTETQAKVDEGLEDQFPLLLKRPKRERRRPGNYWVPNFTIPAAQKEVPVVMRKSPTHDCSSGSEDYNVPTKKSRCSKIGGGGLRRRDARKKFEKPAKVQTLSKTRRLLSKHAVRDSCEEVKDRVLDSGVASGEFYGRSTLICHADDVTLRNKNSGLATENPKVRIGSTISWQSLSGNLAELDPGAMSGPQVDVFKHQVFIVIEGSIVIEFLSEHDCHTLHVGDSAVVPSGSKFTIRNNGSSKTRLNVLNFVEAI